MLGELVLLNDLMTSHFAIVLFIVVVLFVGSGSSGTQEKKANP